MVTPCLWYVVGMKLVCPMSKFPQAPFARAPFGEVSRGWFGGDSRAHLGLPRPDSRAIPIYLWDLACHLQSPKPQNPKRFSKSLPKGVWDPPPGPPKSSEKSPKSPKNPVDFDYFFEFSDLFRNFLGVRGRGVPNSSRETVLRLFGASGFWANVDGRRDPKDRLDRASAGQTGHFHGTNGTHPRDGCSPEVVVSC